MNVETRKCGASAIAEANTAMLSNIEYSLVKSPRLLRDKEPEGCHCYSCSSYSREGTVTTVTDHLPSHFWTIAAIGIVFLCVQISSHLVKVAGDPVGFLQCAYDFVGVVSDVSDSRVGRHPFRKVDQEDDFEFFEPHK